MKGKRYTTEDKIRILRVADGGEKTVQELCREENISEVSFQRWKKQFGQMDVNEAKRLIAEEIVAHPEKKNQALEYSDFKPIHEFICAL